MTGKHVWLITGAGRCLGVDLARAALAAGHGVIATGRDPARVATAVGDHENLLSFRLDVTRPEGGQAAVEAAIGRFGRIDVLVNNAGNFYAGFFEELSPEQVRDQIETLLFGRMNVTRAVLPTMRKQRSGLLLTISSTAGLAGGLFWTAYAAAKFGVEGWIESLTPEIAPFASAHAGRARLLPHRAAHSELHHLCQAIHRRLRRADRGHRRRLERHEWQAGRRPREAGGRHRAARRTRGATGSLRRRRRCGEDLRGQGRPVARSGRGPAPLVHVPVVRRRLGPMTEVVVQIGTGSIGQAIASRVSCGKHVLLGDLRQANVEAAAHTLGAAGFEVSPAIVDVSSRESVHALVERATPVGAVTGLIHAAGVSPSQASPATILRVNRYGTAVVLEEFGSVMERGGAGVVIASQSGHRARSIDRPSRPLTSSASLDRRQGQIPPTVV